MARDRDCRLAGSWTRESSLRLAVHRVSIAFDACSVVGLNAIRFVPDRLIDWLLALLICLINLDHSDPLAAVLLVDSD